MWKYYLAEKLDYPLFLYAFFRNGNQSLSHVTLQTFEIFERMAPMWSDKQTNASLMENGVRS